MPISSNSIVGMRSAYSVIPVLTVSLSMRIRESIKIDNLRAINHFIGQDRERIGKTNIKGDLTKY